MEFKTTILINLVFLLTINAQFPKECIITEKTIQCMKPVGEIRNQVSYEGVERIFLFRVKTLRLRGEDFPNLNTLTIIQTSMTCNELMRDLSGVHIQLGRKDCSLKSSSTNTHDSSTYSNTDESDDWSISFTGIITTTVATTSALGFSIDDPWAIGLMSLTGLVIIGGTVFTIFWIVKKKRNIGRMLRDESLEEFDLRELQKRD